MQYSTKDKRRADSIDTILDIAFAFQKSRVVLTACEFEIFSVIGSECFNCEQIASKIDADKNAVEKLLNALCGLKLLTKKDGFYSNSPITLKHLVHGSEEFMGNLEHIAGTWETWSNLSQTIKTGKSLSYNSHIKQGEKWIENFASAAHWRAKVEAKDIIKLINFKNVDKILDLGGGKGAYAKAFAEAKPSTDVTLFEIPQVAKYAKDNIVEWGLRDRIKVIEGDFSTDDIGKGYDLIFISRLLQLYSIWDNVKLLQKCFDSMKSGGTIVINDMIIDDSRTSPVQHTLYSINLLVNTESGEVYTETDINFKGYVQSEEELDSWINSLTLFQ